jgi:hypothetical protein
MVMLEVSLAGDGSNEFSSERVTCRKMKRRQLLFQGDASCQPSTASAISVATFL